jgi:tripartite-type tricarboxylate transporter receptor subunit TctC
MTRQLQQGNGATFIARIACLKSMGIMMCLLVSWAAMAQTYPDKPIRFVVPMAPGGAVDTVSRSVANVLSKKIGQTVVVDNKPGAGGSIAAGFVANATPDGYTVFVADTGQLSINPSLYKKLPYDTSKNFVAVTEAVAAPLYLAVNAELPIKSVQELIAYGKAAKLPLAYGSVGVGSVHHLGMELFVSKSGIKANHIPFKGASQSAVALASGEVQVALSAMPSLKPLVTAGKVRLLAVTTAQRVPQTPDIPTVAESGVAGYSVAVNVGFVLPPNTPEAIANSLYREMTDVLNTAEVQTQLTNMGLVMMRSSPRDYANAIKEDTDKYRALIKATGAVAE